MCYDFSLNTTTIEMVLSEKCTLYSYPCSIFFHHLIFINLVFMSQGVIKDYQALSLLRSHTPEVSKMGRLRLLGTLYLGTLLSQTGV